MAFHMALTVCCVVMLKVTSNQSNITVFAVVIFTNNFAQFLLSCVLATLFAVTSKVW